jgi:hypothetical protein
MNSLLEIAVTTIRQILTRIPPFPSPAWHVLCDCPRQQSRCHAGARNAQLQSDTPSFSPCPPGGPPRRPPDHPPVTSRTRRDGQGLGFTQSRTPLPWMKMEQVCPFTAWMVFGAAPAPVSPLPARGCRGADSASVSRF